MRRLHLVLLCTILLSASAPAEVRAGAFERVPQDGTLQQAIDRVSTGGIIEIAAGVYPAPANGFRSTANKRYTMRAAAGAEVVLDGQGTGSILLVRGQGVGNGPRVAFEGITFRNGFSTIANRAGGITVEGSEAVFVNCRFENNVMEADNGGGALRVIDNSQVRVTGSRFENNTSNQWGAAIFLLESSVEVTWSELIGNLSNVPGHTQVSAGGAIFVLDAELSVARSRFEANEAGWVGGAIYGIGNWSETANGPDRSQIVVSDSLFVGNSTGPNACCTVPGPPGGGAIHVEDEVTLVVRGSQFLENVTTWGGAISSYRARVDVEGSVFRGNRGEEVDATTPYAGGAILIQSSDFADPSTEFGVADRRPAELRVAQSLLQGRFGSTEHAAQQGGCIFASGDLTRLAGDGVPQAGTAADNRAKVELDQVVLADCDVETGTQSLGLGGGIFLNLADLEMTSSLIFDSDALGNGTSGGALLSLGDSAVTLNDSTLAGNTAVAGGAGVLVSGGEVTITNSRFLDNDISPGVSESEGASPGSALVLARNNALGITGTVEGSIFSGNTGIPIVDRDSSTGTFNEVVYNDNEIRSTSFGNRVYKNTTLGAGGLSVSQLNNLTINRTGAPNTRKSNSPNTALSSTPRTGTVLATPASFAAPLAEDDFSLASTYLGYAWSGTSAQLDGEALADRRGLKEVAAAGSFGLRVGGTQVASATVAEQPCSRDEVLCLNQERFLVEVDWRDPQGRAGDGTVVLSENDSGLYWFFDADNWEMLVKVLDGCDITQHFWVFAAATTDVEYTLRVTDTATGITKSYFNPLGNAAAAITDTSALDVCAAGRAAPAQRVAPLAPAAATRAPGNCTADETHLCLNRQRFEVEIEWENGAGTRGAGQVVPFGSDDSGLFWFFNADNWEMLVKVLDGCGINDRYWVFVAATTDVGYTLRVTDTERGEVRVYTNPVGRAAPATTDTGAFTTCP